NGLLITFLPALLLGVLGDFGGENTTFGDTDFGWLGIAIGYPARLEAVGIVIIALIGLAILGAAILYQKRVVDAHWDPAPHRAPVGAAVASPSPAKPVAAGNYAKLAPPEGAPAPPPPPTG
ncbi:MAG: PTS ascorbate transporter subunit IIC, partial [Nocardioides sp.]|nr:PTS ascorbate transporter subunit IIC [Nocardioides sp.]